MIRARGSEIAVPTISEHPGSQYPALNAMTVVPLASTSHGAGVDRVRAEHLVVGLPLVDDFELIHNPWPVETGPMSSGNAATTVQVRSAQQQPPEGPGIAGGQFAFVQFLKVQPASL
jgi:hypothetical protein